MDDRPFVVYLASGLQAAAVKDHPGMKPLLDRFPGAQLVDKHMLGVAEADETFFYSALDYSVCAGADFFVGIAPSAFSAFVALRRRTLSSVDKADAFTAMLPALEDAE
eukprot:scaffold177488_cov45-Prasinocladus_malaysianus.AAC.1